MDNRVFADQPSPTHPVSNSTKKWPVSSPSYQLFLERCQKNKKRYTKNKCIRINEFMTT